MEQVVVIDGASALGAMLLTLNGKVGGASGVLTLNFMNHPAILCTDLDWSTPGVLQATHLQNPGTGDQAPRRIAIRAQDVLFAHEQSKTPAPAPATQDKPLMH